MYSATFVPPSKKPIVIWPPAVFATSAQLHFVCLLGTERCLLRIGAPQWGAQDAPFALIPVPTLVRELEPVSPWQNTVPIYIATGIYTDNYEMTHRKNAGNPVFTAILQKNRY